MDVADYITLHLITLQFVNRKIYEESFTNNIKVQISTLLIKYLKVISFRFVKNHLILTYSILLVALYY